MAKQGIMCMPCSDANDTIDLLLKQLEIHIDIKVT